MAKDLKMTRSLCESEMRRKTILGLTIISTVILYSGMWLLLNHDRPEYLPYGLSRNYSLDTAIRLGYVAYAAYYASLNEQEMWKWLNASKIHFYNVTSFKDPPTGIVGFVSLIEKDKLMVSFTGTQVYNLPETILADLYIFKTDFHPTGGSVSEGFYSAWLGVKRQVISAITSDIREVWFVGHSLGGAIATLAAADVKYLRPTFSVVSYTYASPRVGDQTFANGYNSLGIITNRIQNYWDVIPRLPWEGWGYIHTNVLILIGVVERKTLCVYGAKPPDNYLSDPLDWIYEHSMDHYLEILEDCREHFSSSSNSSAFEILAKYNLSHMGYPRDSVHHSEN